jgi:ATP-dependent Clp protease adaptor protein ClpS
MKQLSLNIYNDDVNSFHYVIACLIKICKHHPVQAEQCAVITHHVGKCSVKVGHFDELYEMSEELEHLDIKTQIEEYESYMH